VIDESSLEADVAAAQRGDRVALERVVRAIQDTVYNVALRMLGHPDDARDASQEILVKVVTKLGSFQGESRFTTWVFRVATNALLDTRKSLRRRDSTFAEMGTALDTAVAAWTPSSHPESGAVVEEAKYVCTQGMLLCLDRPHRLAYILGEILELSGDEAAAILEISPAAFRKRLSRARADMEPFLASRCGLADPKASCRCHKVAAAAAATGMIERERPRFASLPVVRADQLSVDIEQLRSAAQVFRSLPEYATEEDLAARVRELITLDEPSN
jgi:RNA polymerase sigma factor (sigma-70 family)